MAVLDHEVHEKTREEKDAKWGCHNRSEFKPGYYAPDRVYFPDGMFKNVMKWVPHFGSMECRNDDSLTHTKCEGCHRRGTGEAYSKMVRTKGS